ncbi:MAG: HAD family hydrolase [Burkholderiaceae bacterium]
MNLALFDLDNTLIPVDSDHTWSEFLASIGVIDGEAHNRRNDDFYEQYKAGVLVIEEFLKFQLAPLAAHPRTELDAWHQRFMTQAITPNLHPAAHALVQQHQNAGDLCAIVTATNEFITRPIAHAFGIEHLLAIELEVVDGQFTGRHSGVPSFREGKITRTRQWLAGLGHKLEDFDQSWFYSDSINDLPLMELVSNPVATNPDPKLAEIASARNWPVVNLFQNLGSGSGQ